MIYIKLQFQLIQVIVDFKEAVAAVLPILYGDQLRVSGCWFYVLCSVAHQTCTQTGAHRRLVGQSKRRGNANQLSMPAVSVATIGDIALEF